MSNKKHIRLDDARSVRKFLSKLVGELYRDERDGASARDMAYICKVILEAHQVGELEERLAELERKLTEGK